jgi:hypothetical protein
MTNRKLQTMQAERQREITVAVDVWRQLPPEAQDGIVAELGDKAKALIAEVDAGRSEDGIAMLGELFTLIGMGTILILAEKARCAKILPRNLN